MGSTNIASRLAQRLRAHKLIQEGTKLHRTNASGSQRNEGAWSWFAYPLEGKDLGSHYPMELVLRCTDWKIQETDFGMHIDPLRGVHPQVREGAVLNKV